MVGPGCHQNSGPGGPQSPTKCAGDLCAVSSLERLLGRLHTTAVNALFCTILWVFVWAYSLAWLLSSVALCEPSAPPCQPMPTDYAGGSEYPDYAGMTPGSIVQTLGVASCGTASCHGGPKAGNHDVQSFAYTIWINDDPHSRAFEVLHLPRSRRMASLLGIGEPHRAKQCLACHSMQDQSRSSLPAEVLADGVGCASCHGDSADWQQLHTQPVWKQLSSHERESLGYRDLSGTVARVRNCLPCHVGDAEHEVNHDLIAAGHPRLFFEFAAYQRLWPRHWSPRNKAEASQDFTQRSWAVGQAESLRAVADLLATRTERALQDAAESLEIPVIPAEEATVDFPEGRGGLGEETRANQKKRWPEFAELDCYACHQSLAGDPAFVGRDQKPAAGQLGQPRWQPWYASGGRLLHAELVPAVRGTSRSLVVQQSVEDIQRLLDTDWSATDQQRLRSLLFEARGLSRAARLSAEELSLRPQIVLNGSNQQLNAIVAERPREWRTWDASVQMYLAMEAAKSGGPARGGVAHNRGPVSEVSLTTDLRRSLDQLRGSLRFPPQVDSPQTFRIERFQRDRLAVP